MILLASETSCDETSVAIVANGKVLANGVSSQARLHAEYGGVVPELATREHLRNWMPIARTAMRQAGIEAHQIDALAATQGPGLPNALLIGFKATQAFAFALAKPFLGIHHHEAHLYSPWISGHPPQAEFGAFQPNVSLIVSGGHTMLVYLSGEQQHQLLGGTLDDAAGECFDKTAKLIGLPYPGGPEMDRLASEGNPAAYKFPRPLIHADNHDFSFAGLKTAVRYFLEKHPEILEKGSGLRDLCASVQQAIVDVLVRKTLRAAHQTGVSCVTASGGVTCNRALRSQLAAACQHDGVTLRLADPSLCTDNAAMIGILAERKLCRSAVPSSLDAEIAPNWALE